MITAKSRVPISDQLREKIEASGLTYRRISADAGVDLSSISRFVRGERGLSQEASDALAAYFGLELTPKDGE